MLVKLRVAMTGQPCRESLHELRIKVLASLMRRLKEMATQIPWKLTVCFTVNFTCGLNPALLHGENCEA